MLEDNAVDRPTEQSDKSNIESVSAQDDKQKRVVKLTAKALAGKLERLQNDRRNVLNKVSRLRDALQCLTEKNDKEQVECVFNDLLKKCDEAKGFHASLMGMLPIEEKDKHDVWFKAKMIANNDFISKVQLWVSKWDESVTFDAATGIDDVCPDDSISNVASRRSGKSGNSGRLSTVSSTTKAKAEKAALLARLDALKDKHALEEQEQQIRRKQEQQKLETLLAEFTAKLAVLQASDNQSCAKASNAMNSYFEENMRKPPQRLNPMADEFMYPAERNCMQKESVLAAHPKAQGAPQQRSGAQPTVRPKQRPNLNMQTLHTMGKGLQSTQVTNLPTLDLVLIMQRQNEITSALVKQQQLASLPARDIPLFDGDPLQYISFMRAFEQGVEEKASQSDCLYYLEQFTRGQPRELVRSCLHMMPDQGYATAKHLLQEHFGNKYKVATAYIEKALSWAPIQNEDVSALKAYSLFLRGCCNVMTELDYMQELEMPSNIRAIVSKLPFKLRERWRTIAHDTLETTGNRALFNDLVKVIERHVSILSDPLYGNIDDPPPGLNGGRVTSRPKPYTEQRTKGNSFATTITLVETEQARGSRDTSSQRSYATASTCACCAQSHSLDCCGQLKCMKHRDKIDILKQNRLCFGCLRPGHMSRSCEQRLTCETCTTCGHTRAGRDRCLLSILPVQVKSAKGDKVIQTYAFLDPGSSATFCSEQLMRKLHLNGKRTQFLLQTMGQERVVPSYSLVGLEVSGINGDVFYELPETLTQRKMPVSPDHIVTTRDLVQWPYLARVDVPRIEAGVDLLIGSNVPKILEPWEVINSCGSGPYAMKTALGWVVNGPVHEECSPSADRTSASVNRISVQRLEEMLTNQYNHDFNERATEEMGLSREDRKFMEMTETKPDLSNQAQEYENPDKKDQCMEQSMGMSEDRAGQVIKMLNRKKNM
ncbi:hypothetical protein N1851_020113 [Merluccius polli]|uniref:CCHC-type domain-containing protein n=1 Tax=Merluccius polli TaxID=89951 RepID=A0AA47MLF2_MERPO|nr:hypothetical protein N1851_020113 [Merluccius polli]